MRVCTFSFVPHFAKQHCEITPVKLPLEVLMVMPTYKRNSYIYFSIFSLENCFRQSGCRKLFISHVLQNEQDGINLTTERKVSLLLAF